MQISAEVSGVRITFDPLAPEIHAALSVQFSRDSAAGHARTHDAIMSALAEARQKIAAVLSEVGIDYDIVATSRRNAAAGPKPATRKR